MRSYYLLIVIFRLSENGKPFEAIINIPELRINSNYTSSGILIILPASGSGHFYANFGKRLNIEMKAIVN